MMSFIVLFALESLFRTMKKLLNVLCVSILSVGAAQALAGVVTNFEYVSTAAKGSAISIQ